MGAQTKIIVIKLKEALYIGLFIILAILAIILLINQLSRHHLHTTQETSRYIPGIYSSTVTLGNQNLNISVAVDANSISGVTIDNLNDTITTMYPLLEPALDEINEQITVVDDINNITYSKDNQYTFIILNQAIRNALEKAIPES